MTLTVFVLIQYRSVTDGQTDGETDGHLCSGYTSACIACYANALVKSIVIQELKSIKVQSLSDGVPFTKASILRLDEWQSL